MMVPRTAELMRISRTDSPVLTLPRLKRAPSCRATVPEGKRRAGLRRIRRRECLAERERLSGGAMLSQVRQARDRADFLHRALVVHLRFFLASCLARSCLALNRTMRAISASGNGAS